MVKFMYWLKQNVGKTEIDEITAAAYLDKLRSEVEGNLGLSFGTISAYSDNAAMCHYAVSEESNKKLMPRGLYLVDSGGQYLEGTTDITRTFALGELTEEEKECFTLVASCMLRLLNVKFPYGCHGIISTLRPENCFGEGGLILTTEQATASASWAASMSVRTESAGA